MKYAVQQIRPKKLDPVVVEEEGPMEAANTVAIEGHVGPVLGAFMFGEHRGWAEMTDGRFFEVKPA